MSDLVERFGEIVSNISTREVDLDYDLSFEVDRTGEINAWLYVWNRLDRECRTAMSFDTVEHALEALEAEYRDMVRVLASDVCTHVYHEITSDYRYAIDVDDHPVSARWQDVVADEIMDRLSEDDVYTIVNNVRAAGYWEIAALIQTRLLQGGGY